MIAVKRFYSSAAASVQAQPLKAKSRINPYKLIEEFNAQNVIPKSESIYAKAPNGNAIIISNESEKLFESITGAACSVKGVTVAACNGSDLVVKVGNRIEYLGKAGSLKLPSGVMQVDYECIMNSLYDKGEVKLYDIPLVHSLLKIDGESERRTRLSKTGGGLSTLYFLWKDELDYVDALKRANVLSGGDALQKLISEKVSTIQTQIKQHLETIPKVITASLVGPKSSGKTELVKSIMQGETSVSNLVRIGGREVVLKDSTQQAEVSPLKLLCIDMNDVYGENKKLSQELVESIDADTFVVITKRESINIRTPLPPTRMRFKNSPLGPQGDVLRTAKRGRIPLREEDNVHNRLGNEIEFGSYGVRVLEDIRMTERCLQEVRSSLYREIKKIKGGRFWLKVNPNHPCGKRPVGTRMGKGKSPFDHWEAKVPNGVIVAELGCIKEELAKGILRSVMPLIPGKCEFVKVEQMESVEALIKKIQTQCRIQPKGIFCVSSKTGIGMDGFLEGLSVALADEKLSKREASLSKALSAISSDNPAEASKLIEEIVEIEEANDAKDYFYHDNYGILKKNREVLSLKRKLENHLNRS